MIEIKTCQICKNSDFVNYMQSKDFSVSKETFNIVKCSSCNFVFTNPRPKKMDKYYDDESYISHTNSSSTFFEKIYQSVRKIAIKQKFKLISSYKKSGSILDVGCGTGEFLNACKNGGWKTRGIEPSKKAREKAITNYDLTIDESIILSKTNNTYDVITMWHVLEHVEKINETVSILNRLLESKGQVIIAVPNLGSYDCSYYNKYWAAYDLPIHLSHFTKETISSLFQKHNFKLVKTKGMVFDAFYVSLLSEEYKNGSKNFIKSFIVGCLSNLFGVFTKRGFSSAIYVFEKK